MALKHFSAAVDILMLQLKGKERATDITLANNDEDETKRTIARALIGQVEIWMDPAYDLWWAFFTTLIFRGRFIVQLALTPPQNLNVRNSSRPRCRLTRKIPKRYNLSHLSACPSRDPKRRRGFSKKRGPLGKTQRLVGSNAQHIPALCLTSFSVDDPRLPPIASRLNLTKLCLELSLFTPALMVLQGIMASDDEEVEAWYLEGWCFFLMSEQAREQGGKLDELTWEELARDSRDCLETCKMVCFTSSCLMFRSPQTRIIAPCESGTS
jgi:hypothetical protein